MAGIDFTELTLEDLPFFKKQSFDLSRKGISLVLGKNLDSSNQNPNGAGKSLFFSQLPELLLNEPVIGDRKDTIRKGKVSLSFTKGATEYKIIRSFSPRERIQIFKNGQDLEYRELAAAKAAVQKLVPYSEAEVLSMLYIDSRVPHPLIRGSNALRRDFFMKFFRMHAAPTMRKVIKSELDQLAADSIRLDEARKQRSSIKEKLSKPSDVQKKELEALNVKVVELEKQCKAYSRVRLLKTGYSEAKSILKKLDSVGLSQTSTREEVREASEKVQQRLLGISESLKQWKVYRRWLSEKSDTKKQLDAILKKMPANAMETMSLKEWRVELEKEVERKKALRQRHSNLEQSIETLKIKLRHQGERFSALEGTIETLLKITDVCPTCGGPYTNKHAKSELKSARSELSTVNQSIDSFVAERNKLKEELASVGSSLEKAEAQVERCTKVVDLWEQYKRLKVDLDEPEKPSLSEEELLAKKATLEGKAELLVEVPAALKAYKEWSLLSEKDRELADGEDPTPLALKLYEKQSNCSMELQKTIDLEDDLKKTSTKISTLRASLEEKPELELLYQAFSRQGVETQMIRSLCARIEQQVNKYAQRIFPEDYKFSFELESQFNILVTRKYGKRVVTSDVRKLSGAESLLFSLVLFVALLAFISPKNRCNLLILDEPTATFGPEMIEAFVRFLPILNSVVDHVVVITPLPYTTYDGAKVWTVVKRGGQSRFVENSPARSKSFDSERHRGTTVNSA